MPRVSIVIPAFNAARDISTSVHAALGQTVDDLEVIVVNDGSSDDTKAVVDGIRDSRLRIVDQPNQGQSAAINRGVAESTGDFVSLLDADDWIHPEHISEQLRVLHGFPGHIASCRWGYFHSDYRHPNVAIEATHQDYSNPMDWIVDSLTLDEGMMGGWMWLIPRGVWQQAGGYDTRLSLNNDFDFSIRTLLSSCGVRFASEATYSYRKTIGSGLSSSIGRRAMESALLTTELGTQSLLKFEDSPRIRRLCANRFQEWQFVFYPRFADLAATAGDRVIEYGGSSAELQGGRLLQALRPVVGWKAVRQLQEAVRRLGWKRVLSWKARRKQVPLAHIE